MRIIILITFLLLGCNSKREDKSFIIDSTYFNTISKNDIKLGEPSFGQWRFYHNEVHQTFEDYEKLNPVKAKFGETKIYLQPIGEFSDDQVAILESMREYLEIFFQLPTVLLEKIPDSNFPDSAKRFREDSIIQLYTPYMLDKVLKGKIPNDGYALMAISEKDIYPSPDWNFVFGIASYADRVGVTSIFRLKRMGLAGPDNALCLKRLFKIALMK